MQRATPVLDTLLYLVCAGVLYGSLFPFDFSVAEAGAALDVFLASWNRLPGRGDILGNIFLFVPFGVLSGLLVRRDRRSMAWVCGVWLLVALGSQVLQLFLPSRDPAIFDLYTNAVGALAGYLLARLLPADMVRVDGIRYGGDYVPLSLAALWLAWELLPFLPSIDLQAYKTALKPLLLTPRFTWYEAVLQAMGWFCALYMFGRVTGARLRAHHVLATFVVVLALKVVIVMNSVAVTDVVAMAAAFIAWLGLGRGPLNHLVLVVLLMLVWWLDAVSPFAIRATAEDFNWVPFSGFLEGSMLVNVIALCRKGFFFGAIAWLLLRDNVRFVPAVCALAFALLLLEVLQVFLYAGHPEITDPLLFLAIAWLIRRVDVAQVAAAAPVARVASNTPARPVARRKQLLVVVGAYVLLACIALKTLLSLPGIPYNVVELFRFGGNGIDLFFFSLAMLSIGIGGAWFGKQLYSSARPFRTTLWSFLAASVVTFVLLWLGVSQESVRDIAGSTVIVHRVMERGVLGEAGVRLFELLGPQRIHSVALVVEPVVRFTALIAPLFIFLGLCALRLWRNVTGLDQGRDRWYIPLVALALLGLLLLAKVIAFDWSSTDNLNELIARDGEWGLGGGGYLYLLVFTLCAVAIYLAETVFLAPARLLRGLLVLLCSLPLTWWLLQNGLEDNVQKYGRTFSGVDFLLGPDRDNLVSSRELFMRWTFVSTVASMGLAFGAALCVAWYRDTATGSSERRLDVDLVEDEFRLYADQADFLRARSMAAGPDVSKLVNDILAYFGAEMGRSPASVDAVRGYLARSAGGRGRLFAQRPLRVSLTPAALGVFALVDPEGNHSRSRSFRKLLDIYIEAEGEQARDRLPS